MSRLSYAVSIALLASGSVAAMMVKQAKPAPTYESALSRSWEDVHNRVLAMAKDTLNQMAQNTNKVAQKESIRIAMGIEEQNTDLAKAIDDLGAYGEVVRAATNITREGLTDMRAKLDELKKLAEDVQGDVHDAIGVHADVARPQERVAEPEATGATPSPFKLGQH